MSYDFFRFLGDRLGSPVQAKLLYFFLAYQVIISALVFLFDSGFPALLVFAGWVLFMILLASQILHRRRIDMQEEKKDREQEQLRLQRISRMKKLLETDSCLQTRCRDCANVGTGGDSCQAHARPAEREFRFRNDDAQSYCLLWSPGRKEDSSR
jgi:hypothetical protein